MTVNLTESEYRSIEKSARKAGMLFSCYIREMTLRGQVQARLTKEELAFFMATVGLSNDLHQLAQLARTEGLTSILPVFEGLRDRIDNALTQMNL
jgi:hypothetical protein